MSSPKRKKSAVSDVEETASLSPTDLATPCKRVKTEAKRSSSPGPGPKTSPNAKTDPSIGRRSSLHAAESGLLAGSLTGSPTGSAAADVQGAEDDGNPVTDTQSKSDSPSIFMTQTSEIPTSGPSAPNDTPTSSKKPSPQTKSRKRKQSRQKDSVYVYSGDETDEPLTKSQKQQQQQPKQRRRSPGRAYHPPPETPTTATTTTGTDFNTNVADEDGELHEVLDDGAAPEGMAREANLSVLERAAAARKYERERRRSTELVGLRSQEYRLFETIDHRGFEPFLPVSWHLDFPFKVDAYFGESSEESHINSTDFEDSNANFRAIRALQTLLKMGPIARDRLEIMGLRPEQSMARQIREYIAWSERDAGLSAGGSRTAPRLLTMAFDDDEEGGDATRVIQALERKMRRSAAEWKNWQQKRGLAVAMRREEQVAAEMGSDKEGEPEEGNRIGVDQSSNDAPHHEKVGRREEKDEEKANTSQETKQARKRRRSSFVPGVLRWVRGVFGRKSFSLAPSTPTLSKTAKRSDHSESRSRNSSSNKSQYVVEAVYGIAISHLVIAILTMHVDDDVDYESDTQRSTLDPDYTDTHDATRNGHDNNDDETADSDSDSDSENYIRSTATVPANSGTFRRSNNGMDASQNSSEEDPSLPNRRRRGTGASGSHNRSPSSRVLFYVDFAKVGEDVWNAVAVAMAVCHCRDLRVRYSDVVGVSLSGLVDNNDNVRK